MNLRDLDWQPAYSHEDGDLVDRFFLPALSCARLYQRVTGYFNQEALASRRLDSLGRNGGRMQLVVGCTLEQEEVDAIEAGHAIRTLIEKGLHKRPQDLVERERLGWLSWMVAHGYLDTKLAVPKDPERKYRAGLGLYHAKAGRLVNAAGDKLAFRGSINETLAGWKQNCESFDVSCSWQGTWDLQHVEKTEQEFRELWRNRAESAEVIEVPNAVRQHLLQYLLKDDRFVKPPADVEEAAPLPTPDEPDAEERHQRVWAFI